MAKRTEAILEILQHKNAFETQKTLAVEFNQPVQKIENLKAPSRRLCLHWSHFNCRTIPGISLSVETGKAGVTVDSLFKVLNGLGIHLKVKPW